MRQELVRLREEMHRARVDALIIPTDDFHGSEYVGEYFKCREYISGFTGSAGQLLVLKEFAGLWTDGRYFLQAEKQLKGTGITLMKMGEKDVPTLTDYLKEHIANEAVVAFDGRCISCGYYESLKKALTPKNVTFVYDKDLAGAVWENRPSLPQKPIYELDCSFTGESRKARMERVISKVKEYGATCHVLTSLDDIAWTLNLRGSDVEWNPVAMCYLYLHTDGSGVLYCATEAVDVRLVHNLKADGICLKDYNAIYDDLSVIHDERILVDKDNLNMAILEKISDENAIIFKMNPSTEMKAVKTDREVENEKEAHLRDGVAFTRLIYYLKNEMAGSREYKEGKVTEIFVADKLEALRKEQKDYLYQSFSPIIGSGDHGAIIHYEATEETDKPIEMDSLLLMDVGAQFLQGTTDVTRTIAIGKATSEMKKHYTLVLKGHLRLGNCVFKEGVAGQNLDYVAREAIYREGLDYNHGTGHGVGYLLNVHEGPQNIRWSWKVYEPYPIKAGMITSDEPGLYFPGKYGIRIENLMVAEPCMETEFGKFLRFSMLTLVPYDKDCIDVSLLTGEELSLLNQYHERVYLSLADMLPEKERAWLREATSPMVEEA